MDLSLTVKTALVGSATACVSLPFEHPFDALKTNMQSSQKQFMQTIRLMFNRKGWKAFYNGFAVNLVRVSLKYALRWPLWMCWGGYSLEYFSHLNVVLRQSLVGVAITISELLIICPLERLKTWLMTTQKQCQTSVFTFFSLNRDIRNWYAGFWATAIRQGLSWASFLATSDLSKEMYKRMRNMPLDRQMGFTDLMVTSVPVAIINTLMIMPIDCIKTFYQDYHGIQQKNTLYRVIADKFRQYKLRGLYKGWQAKMIQYMINSTFTLSAFESISFDYFKTKKEVRL